MAEIRCIVADDFASSRRGIELLLEEEADIEVVGTARDGADARLLIDELHPDVAVVDMRMPGIDGVELCRALQESRSSTGVVLYTAYSEPEGFQAGLDAGARGFLLKGAPPE